MFGFFPAIGIARELIERTPSGKRQQQPMHRYGQQHPAGAQEATPSQSQQTEQARGNIAGRDRDCRQWGKQAADIANKNAVEEFGQKEGMHQRGQHGASDDQ
ncbi:MAG TPA: hypothetical protein VNQ74_03025, partial [Burkholderiaceae bacterium]|nr:hypothetical protein [Burkholderiaceae bacterium]